MDENNNVVVRVPEQQIIRGEDGYSPVVTIENIEHGHSVTITDREHQEEGQTFNVLDGASAYEQAAAGGYTKSEAQFNAELGSFGVLSEETKEVAPFYAEYGVTTMAQIESAINNKRQIYLLTAPLTESTPKAYVMPLIEKFEYQLTYGGRIGGYRFSITDGANQHIAELANSGWTFYTNNLDGPADRAAAAAQQALSRMNSADQSAQSAAGSASNASRDAGTASAAATTATTKAGEASDSATAADGSAKDAEAYAVGKRGGTDVGSTDPAYNNNAKYYAEQASDNATAAGNAQTAAETAQGLAEDAQEAAEQAQSDAEAAAQSVSQSAAQISQNASDISDLKSAVDQKAPAIYNTASGAIASFDDGAGDMPVKELTIDGLDEGQTAVVTRVGKNFLDRGAYTTGYTINDRGEINSAGETSVISAQIPVIAGAQYTFSCVCYSTGYKRVAAYTDDGIFISPLLAKITNITYGELRSATFTIPDNAAYLIIGLLTPDIDVQLELGSSATTYDTYRGESYNYPNEKVKTLYGINNIWSNVGDISVKYAADTQLYLDLKSQIHNNNIKPYPGVRSINHRGWYECPENTLIAYKQSKIHGFGFGECDIKFTEDDVPVLLHDSSINRTARNSDGTEIAETVNINSITYEQALTYDFGIYKGAQYAGTKIPTLSEYLTVCRNIGLSPYIEIKTGSTKIQNNIVAAFVKKSGIVDEVTFISSNINALKDIMQEIPDARYGLILWTYDDTYIALAKSLFNDRAEVFLDLNQTQITDDIAVACANAFVPVEAWTPNAARILTLNPYVSGFTSNESVAKDVLYNAEIGN